ncbi:L,D-transpeptidase family protein [Motilimonas pumila]|uniref:Murein L,D-transpeptidase n=1 Tax=Motilimonas pumila TaxID=2303987 RepID=A0A418YIK0_9GAMM|nr:L,D-transpeptidase family protein [Motilimonas pumila]RJG50468.1 murein L,D-transpeptidase [Motilimonas pumila]
MKLKVFPIASACLLAWQLCFTTAWAEDHSNVISDVLEPITLGETFRIGQDPIHESKLVSYLYQGNDMTLLWPDKAYVEQVIVALGQAEAEGLRPQDYHYQTLLELFQQGQQSQWQDIYLTSKFDILMTDATIRYASHLANGKVDPSTLSETWNYDAVKANFDTGAADFADAITEQKVVEKLEGLKPQLALYDDLKQQLAKFRDLAKQHPFEPISLTQRVLKPAEFDDALLAIRERLTLLGYDVPPADEPSQYTPAMVALVKLYQSHHDLETDGVIGPGTLKVLNTSFAARAEQIQLNLERARWVSSNLSQEFIVVNAAGFQLYYFKDGEKQWQTNVVVGLPYRKTPMFKSQLQYLEFNPTWTVPRSIVREMWHHVEKDPHYLQQRNYKVVESNGTPVDMASIDWSRYTGRNFPYYWVQQPGPGNALGQVKFIFPNPHSIFLHDTPQKSLFNKAQRTFSHGCIRVEDPLEFANQLLADPSNWSEQKIHQVVDSGNRTRVSFKRPIDVFIMYWTTTVKQGQIYFHQDPYHRDAAILKQLLES